MDGQREPLDIDSLLERVAALKHDLGKYVAWTSANLDEGVWTKPASDELIDALCADLLETRKLPESTHTAWEVWVGHRGGLSDPLEPELEIVAAAAATIERVLPALRTRDREAIGRECANIRAAQQDIRTSLRDLHRRLLAKSADRGPRER